MVGFVLLTYSRLIFPMIPLRKIFHQIPGLSALYPPPAAYAHLRKCLATSGQEDALRALLKTYPDAVRWEKPGDLQPLAYALWRKQTGSAAELIAADKTILADLNKDDHTPLMQAAVRGYPDTVSFLLQHGAEADAVNAAGSTALHLSAGHQLYWETIEPLLDAGADVKKPNAQGLNALQIAAGLSPRSFSKILEYDNDLSQRTKDGKTLAMLAAENGNRATLNQLLQAGADTQQKCNAGLTVMIYALKELQMECVILLLEHGMTVDPNHPRLKDMVERNNGHDPFTPVIEQQKEKRTEAEKIEKARILDGNINSLRNGTHAPITLRRVTFKKPPFKQGLR